MGMISVKHKGDFRNTERFFGKALRQDYLSILRRYGQQGVELLRAATPSESGETADAWSYEIERHEGKVILAFTNSHENRGVNIVKLIIFGHGLWNGGYVEGNDFVSPAIQQLLSKLANEAWREVTK